MKCDTTEVIEKILVFGDYLIGATTSQIFIFKKPTGTKLATEFYTSIQLSSLDGEIIGETPIDVKCIPDGLTIFVPKEAAPPSAAEKLEGLPDLIVENKVVVGFAD